MHLPLFIVSFSCLLIAFGFCAWLLIKDRKYWRDQYQARDQEAKQERQHLFDQLLRLKGVRTVQESNTPPPAIMRAPMLDSEDLEIIDARIDERVRAGIMTPSEGWMLAGAVREGKMTTAEVDQVLWKRTHPQDYVGSVADID